ncbi:MAG: hypothetical protein HRF48_11920 [Chloroflexota bacterium]|jgi:hypothetical protein
MADDLDALRRSALEEEITLDPFEDHMAAEVSSDKMFGMTAAERMFVSIGCFILTSLAGFLLLLIMDKIAL